METKPNTPHQPQQTLRVGDLDIPENEIMNMGAISASNERISLFFNLPLSLINTLMADTTSHFAQLYHRGKAVQHTREKLAIAALAANGNLEAIKHLHVSKLLRKNFNL